MGTPSFSSALEYPGLPVYRARAVCGPALASVYCTTTCTTRETLRHLVSRIRVGMHGESIRLESTCVSFELRGELSLT